MARFFHYILRTTDAPAARAFYGAVLAGSEADIVPLHEQALARGARPHWLGFVQVAEVDAAAAAFAENGASALGPKWINPQGLEAAVMRDPGGALVALAKAPPAARLPHPEVVWHQLNASGLERVKESYQQLLGWDFKPSFDLPGIGALQPFAWQPGGSVVGSLSDVAGRPGVHPHWLFHFRVPSLEPALEAVREGGGLALPALTLPNGDRVAACDDAQGAAFALFEQRAPR